MVRRNIKAIAILMTFILMISSAYSFSTAMENNSQLIKSFEDDQIDAVTSATETAIKLQIGNPLMNIDGDEKEIDPGRGTVPIIVENRTLLPVRAVIEAVCRQ